MEIPSSDGSVLKHANHKKAEMVFIPSPGIGHLVSAIEMARLLVNRDERLSVTFLIMQLTFDAKFTNFTKSLTASTISDGIRFVDLPLNETALDVNSKDIVSFFMETYKPYVKEAVSKLMTQSEDSSNDDSPPLVGFFVDMFTTTMIDVANEFGLPSYVFFTSSAGFLSLMFYLQSLHDEQNIELTEFKNSNTELVLSTFRNPIPARVLPTVVLNKDSVQGFLNFARRYRETKGIVVNTVLEMESHVFNCICDSTVVPVYPVGPILNTQRGSYYVDSSGTQENEQIMKWLDRQPPLSVVFLCFGSMGSFSEDQVKEIAYALEHSGYRFLWSLRQPPPKGMLNFPSNYDNPSKILPEGFMDRTAEIGKIIGWAPQVAVLAHPAVGGFVSHCGWNSILESLWFEVPIATWPIDGEQQFNAFEMVIELGLAVEIKLDYRKELFSDNEVIVSAENIERSIRNLMKDDGDIRQRVKEVSQKNKKALMDGGSSYTSLDRFIQDFMAELP